MIVYFMLRQWSNLWIFWIDSIPRIVAFLIGKRSGVDV